MTDPSSARQIYEQPLNERMRAFLRLEHLFQRIDFHIEPPDAWSSRVALETIIELIALLGRADTKNELIKELERHASTLDALARDPRVDPETLSDTLDQVRGLLASLRAQDGAIGLELRSNELVNTVRQRASIPAGTCDFDLPALHFWLALPAEQRQADLRRWLAAFALIREAVELCLSLVRRSAVATAECAAGGFFQKTLDGATPCQLVRVALPTDAGCFTEISAGRHRFTVRFMTQSSADTRAVQVEEDVPFELHCCTI